MAAFLLASVQAAMLIDGGKQSRHELRNPNELHGGVAVRRAWAAC